MKLSITSRNPYAPSVEFVERKGVGHPDTICDHLAEELVRAGVQDSDLNERLHLMTAEILSRPRLSRIIDDHDLYKDDLDRIPRSEIIERMRQDITIDLAHPRLPDLEDTEEFFHVTTGLRGALGSAMNR